MVSKVQKLLESKVDLGRLGKAGEYSNLHEKLCRDLAREYQEKEKAGSSWCISWPNQVKAQEYFNRHGFTDTLQHMLDLRDENGERA